MSNKRDIQVAPGRICGSIYITVNPDWFLIIECEGQSSREPQFQFKASDYNVVTQGNLRIKASDGLSYLHGMHCSQLLLPGKSFGKSTLI